MTLTVQKTDTKSCWYKKPGLLYGLIFFILLLCYHNSFQASWHFDDVANILLNSPLHLDNLHPTYLKQTFFAYPDQPGKLLRPISNLTFGINWFFGQDSVLGYHVVNFVIHFLTTLVLYHTCLLILSTPKFGCKYQKNKFFIAALAALIWAVNPVQTQAVTYIVQRMASLATLFYVSGLWCYLKARLLPLNTRRSFFYFVGTCLFFFLALGSKENTVVFPASILLVELLFFQETIKFNKQTSTLFLAGLGIILASTLLLVGPGIFSNIIGSYETRDFTLWQRVLTEARIVVFYISLLLYPSPFRLSITHDIAFSTSLLSPFSTLSSVLTLALLTVLPLIYHRKYPLLSFAGLFFLLNHIVESTIIPLETIFEHRNYLPSLFLFLPLAAALSIIIEMYRRKSRILYFATSTAIIVLIVLLCLGTMSRNEIWRTEESLWTDSLSKAPESARSYINLAHGYLYQDKNYQKAFELYYISLDKFSPTSWKDRLRAFNNMGYIMTRAGNYEKALSFYDNALNVSKAGSNSALNSWTIIHKAKAQLLFGQTHAALDTLVPLVEDSPDNGGALQLYGEILVADGRITEGLSILHRALSNSSRQSREYIMALLDLSLVYGRLNSSHKADFFINLAKKMDAPAIPKSLCIIENSLRTDQPALAESEMLNLLSEITWPEFMALVEEKSPERPTLPLSYPLLRQYVSDWLTSNHTQ